MTIKKYAKKDIMPIVVLTISLMSSNLINFTFKYIVDLHYPDLKPHLNMDDMEVHETSIDLLQAQIKNDPLVELIDKYLLDIAEQVEKLMIINELGLNELYGYPRLLSAAEDIYWSRICFQDEQSGHTDSRANLELYANSLFDLVHCLCKLVVFEVLDLENPFNDDIYNSFYEDSFTRMPVDEDVNEVILFELLLRIKDYNTDIISCP